MVVEYAAVRRAEHAESVAREKHAVGRIVAHHRLGPVHPRRKDELQIMIPQRKRVAVLDLDQIGQLAEVGFQNAESFRIAHDPHVGILADQVLDLARMVKLHVMNDQIVERASLERIGQPVQIAAVAAALDGIHQGALLVLDQV